MNGPADWQDSLEYAESIVKSLKVQFAKIKKSSLDDLPGILDEIEKLLQGLKSNLDYLKGDVREELRSLSGIINNLRNQLKEGQRERDETLRKVLSLWDKYKEKAEKALNLLQERRDFWRKEYFELLKELQPPFLYGTFIQANGDGTADVYLSDGRRARAAVPSPEVALKLLRDLGLVIPGLTEDLADPSSWKMGQRVLLVPSGNVLVALPQGFEEKGSEATVDEVFEDGRIRLLTRMDEKIVVVCAGSLDPKDLKPADKVRYDPRTGLIFEKLPRDEAKEYLMEEIPNITFDDVGGQREAIENLTEYLLHPIAYPEIYKDWKVKLPHGMLIYGPPGCGKTLILKAVGNALKTKLGKKVYLFTVRGPEFLTKWVGETEAKIREPFIIAKRKTEEEGALVMILFDEIESIFPVRGTVAGDPVVDKAVTQFSTMLDGVEEFGNVIVVGTTNRPDMIDPALLRPGRLDPQIKVDRPDKEGVIQVFQIHLRGVEPNLHPKYFAPTHKDYKEEYKERFGQDRQKFLDYLVQRATRRIFGDDGPEAFERQRIVTIRFFDTQERKIFYMKDLISGAIIASIVDRAKRFAISDQIKGLEKGLRISHLLTAIEEVFEKGKFLPSQADDPRKWASILDLPLTRPFEIIEFHLGERKKEEKPLKEGEERKIF